ncbi:MAG: hypothetical protein E6Q98_20645 [Rhodospirillaceae bacterium]|nr:MAG: hypothetical protein E6Q98_20645 [Rhodospirillaceae bacterium]
MAWILAIVVSFIFGGAIAFFFDRARYGQWAKLATYIAAGISTAAGVYLAVFAAEQSQIAADQKALMSRLTVSRDDINDVRDQILAGTKAQGQQEILSLADRVIEFNLNVVPLLAQDSNRLGDLDPRVSKHIIRVARTVDESYLSLAVAAASIKASPESAGAISQFKSALDKYQTELDFAESSIGLIAETQIHSSKQSTLLKDIEELEMKRRKALYSKSL